MTLTCWLFIAALAPATAHPQTPAQTQSPTQTQTPPASPARPDRTPVRPADPTRPTQAAPIFDTQGRDREIDLWRWNRRPIFRLGQDYVLRSDDVVRHVVIVSGNARIEGRVFEDVVVVLGDVHLASSAVIEGSVVAVAGKVTVDAGATVRRDLVVTGGTVDAPVAFSPRGEHIVIGLPVLGERVRSIVPWVTRGLLWGRPIVPDIGWVWMVVLVFFGLSFILNFVFDRATHSCATVMIERPLSALVVGLLTLVLLGPIVVIMAATVVGIAVIPFFLCAVVLAWMIGKVGVARSIGAAALGHGASDSRSRGMASFLLGFAVITLIYMVPVIGLATWAMVGVFGLGAATMTLVTALRREAPAKAPPPPAGPPSPDPSSPSPAPPSGDVYVPGSSAAMSSAVVSSAPLAFQYQSTEPSVHAPPPTGDLRPTTAVPGAAATAERRPYATFLDRVAAFALDCLLVAIANNLLDLTNHGGPFFLLLLVYHVAFWAWMGTTMGGIVVGIRVVRTTGGNLRIVDALVRGLGSLFSIAALGIGCLWMLQDPERQMWHDKIAGTYVVKVPRNLLLN